MLNYLNVLIDIHHTTKSRRYSGNTIYKFKKWIINLGIFLEWQKEEYKQEIKEIKNSLLHPKIVKFRWSTKPKYAMQMSLVISIFFMFFRNFAMSIIFMILFIYFWQYKKWVSGDWKVYYREKYGLEKR